MIEIERKVSNIGGNNYIVSRRLVTPLFFVRLKDIKVKVVRSLSPFLVIDCGFFPLTQDAADGYNWETYSWVGYKCKELEDIRRTTHATQVPIFNCCK